MNGVIQRLDENDAEIERMAGEEAGLASQLAAEPSRWADLNRTPHIHPSCFRLMPSFQIFVM